MREGEECWASLIGASEAALRERFGEPTTRRAVGTDLWLVFDTPSGRLRLRCRVEAKAAPGVASWTVTFREPHDTLAGAARAVGLWPAAAPDVAAVDVEEPLVRRPLRAASRNAGEGAGLSMTATVCRGRFDRISVFDEAPDWL